MNNERIARLKKLLGLLRSLALYNLDSNTYMKVNTEIAVVIRELEADEQENLKE